VGSGGPRASDEANHLGTDDRMQTARLTMEAALMSGEREEEMGSSVHCHKLDGGSEPCGAILIRGQEFRLRSQDGRGSPSA
jgi:hypothetical protein